MLGLMPWKHGCGCMLSTGGDDHDEISQIAIKYLDKNW